LFALTKDLEGNSDKKEAGGHASHGSLWEAIPSLEHVLRHFEDLERQAKAGAFNNHRGIQESITLAWSKTKEYYIKTDASIVWIGSMVLHPRWK
jgi:hypothetical protein